MVIRLLIVENTQGFTVVAEDANGIEAVDLVRRLRPDVVLMDIRMPGLDGIEATRRIAGPQVDAPRAC